MKNIRKTVFISDLHLQENEPLITQSFLHFLKQCDSTIDAIYILGDLFEIWIGDDDQSIWLEQILQAIRAITIKGIMVYILHGNRDFLISKRFLRKTGCQLLPDETKIILYNTPILLMHGDTLCTLDTTYLKARKRLRNPLLQKLFLLLPLKLRKRLADSMRKASKRHTKATAMNIMDVSLEEVEHVMQKHDAYYLIHGHTHRLGIHQFTLNHQPAMRIVLGAWHHQGSALIWDNAGNKDLIEI